MSYYDLLNPCPICEKMNAMADPGHAICRKCEGVDRLSAAEHEVARAKDEIQYWRDKANRVEQERDHYKTRGPWAKLEQIEKLMLSHIEEDKEMKRIHGIGMSGIWIAREVLGILKKPEVWMEAEMPSAED